MAGPIMSWTTQELLEFYQNPATRYQYRGTTQELTWEGLPGRESHYSRMEGNVTNKNYAYMWNLIITSSPEIERALEFFGAMLWTDPELETVIPDMDPYKNRERVYLVPDHEKDTEQNKQQIMGKFLTMMRCGHEKVGRVGPMLAAQTLKDKESWCHGSTFPTDPQLFAFLRPYFEAEKEVTKIVMTAFLLHKSSIAPSVDFLKTCQIVGICKRRLFQMGFISMLLKTVECLNVEVQDFLGRMICPATNKSQSRLRYFFESEFIGVGESILYAKSFDRKYFTTLALKKNLFIGAVCQTTLVHFKVGAKTETFLLPAGNMANIAIQMSKKLTSHDREENWEGSGDLLDIFRTVLSQEEVEKKAERADYIITPEEATARMLEQYKKKEREERERANAPVETVRNPIVVEGARPQRAENVGNQNNQPQNNNPQGNANRPTQDNPQPAQGQQNQENVGNPQAAGGSDDYPVED